MKIPTPYAEGQIVFNQGYEFIVTEPRLHKLQPNQPKNGFTHQFTYKGICTADKRNDSIRNTGYNGGVYGFGVNIESVA